MFFLMPEITANMYFIMAEEFQISFRTQSMIHIHDFPKIFRSGFGVISCMISRVTAWEQIVTWEIFNYSY